MFMLERTRLRMGLNNSSPTSKVIPARYSLNLECQKDSSFLCMNPIYSTSHVYVRTAQDLKPEDHVVVGSIALCYDDVVLAFAPELCGADNSLVSPFLSFYIRPFDAYTLRHPHSAKSKSADSIKPGPLYYSLFEQILDMKCANLFDKLFQLILGLPRSKASVGVLDCLSNFRYAHMYDECLRGKNMLFVYVGKYKGHTATFITRIFPLHDLFGLRNGKRFISLLEVLYPNAVSCVPFVAFIHGYTHGAYDDSILSLFLYRAYRDRFGCRADLPNLSWLFFPLRYYNHMEFAWSGDG